MNTMSSIQKTTIRNESKSKVQRFQDGLFLVLSQFSALFVLIVLLGIIISLIINAMPALKEFGLGFFVSSDWDINKQKFGGLISIYGTLVCHK